MVVAWRRGAVVDVALDGDWGADSLAEEADDLEVALALVHVTRNPIADLQRLGRLGSLAVDLHVAAPAGIGGLGSGGTDADRPQPGVDPARNIVIRRAGPGHPHNAT